MFEKLFFGWAAAHWIHNTDYTELHELWESTNTIRDHIRSYTQSVSMASSPSQCTSKHSLWFYKLQISLATCGRKLLTESKTASGETKAAVRTHLAWVQRGGRRRGRWVKAKYECRQMWSTFSRLLGVVAGLNNRCPPIGWLIINPGRIRTVSELTTETRT